MTAGDVLAGAGKKPIGTGTKVSGYVDDPTPKQCQTCEYFIKGGLCKNKVVGRDPEVPLARRSKLKKVDPVNGCCSFWETSRD